MTRSIITNQGAGQAIQWLVAKESYEAAKQRLYDAREELLKFTPSIAPFVVVNSQLGQVSVQVKERRDFDAERLVDLIPLDVAEDVTTVKVVHDRFDDAVMDGRISAQVVSKVTVPTPYVAVSRYTADL